MSIQRNLAAKILKCGIGRIWIDPESEKVKQAITRKDVRGFIKDGIIKKLPAKKNLRKKIKKQQKRGSRKGSKKTRIGKKEVWLKIVRPQRKLLLELKETKKLQPGVYRKVYRRIKGNAFRNKSHLKLYLKEKGYLKGEK